MPAKKISPRDAVLEYLEAALATGIRGPNRDAVQHAIDVLCNSHSGLTDLQYRNLKAGDKLLDPDRPGFLMRANQSARWWIYRYQHPETDKQVELKLGRYPDLGLSDARTLWSRLREQRLAGRAPQLVEVADNGADMTVEQLGRRYLVEYAEKVKRSWRTDQQRLERELFPAYGGVPAQQFGADHVKAILFSIKNRGAAREAELVRALLRVMFEVAVGHTRKIDFPDGPWLPITTGNPVDAVSLAERKVTAFKPSAKDLRSYTRNLTTLADADARDALTLQMQTCARVAEVTDLVWSEIDLEAGTWTLPAARSKNGHEHVVMLPTQSIELPERRRSSGTDSAFVFLTKRGHLRSDRVIKALAGNRKVLGVPDRMTSHSLRHACLTWLAESGCQRELRDRISNQLPPKIGAEHLRGRPAQPGRARLAAEMV